ncbi:MAG TPA: serine racemase VanT catalytic subunit [Mobilitalea sp.]|nr:serine racemase VanT catalytic subunit [Mobilitalea sp.]
MKQSKEYGGIDNFRIIAAFLIVAIHTSPLSDVNEIDDFILTRVIARSAVPFFFMTSGFFIFAESGDLTRKIIRFVKKTGLLYGIAIVLYLPINIYMGYFQQDHLLLNIIKDLVFDGTMYHLWYLPAAMLGAVLAALLIQRMSLRRAFWISLILYLIGLFGDSYYGISIRSETWKGIYNAIFLVSDYTRNGIFFAPIFFVLGGIFSRDMIRITMKKSLIGLSASLVLMLVEGLLLHRFNLMRHDSMYLMLIACMFFLYCVILQWKVSSHRAFRDISMIIYIIHPMVIVIIRAVAKPLKLQELFVNNSVIHYVVVAFCSGMFALCAAFLLNKIKTNRRSTVNNRTSRSWIEINIQNLKYNARLLQSLMPPECVMMAVVKANAYGHGAVRVSKCMNENGVRAFAVATIDEGIALRKRGIRGDILVLGYTDITRTDQLKHYRLIQTVIDYDYAIMLNSCRKSVEVHIKIDTGMHRLGICAENIDKISEVFQLKGLKISGIYTHLCVADSLEEEAVKYTRRQIDRFYHLLKQLEDRGITLPKIHIQSSYGLLNYPGLHCNYARIGIALYGSLSKQGDRTKLQLQLRPVLALKARVAMIREVAAGEGVGYGRDFHIRKDSRIAVLPIGYADGLPRSLTDGSGSVLVHGFRVPIIGRICMDQLLIDITGIPEVKQGDIATLIGTDGDEEIPAVNVAKSAGSITNELFSRLGARIDRIYI